MPRPVYLVALVALVVLAAAADAAKKKHHHKKPAVPKDELDMIADDLKNVEKQRGKKTQDPITNDVVGSDVNPCSTTHCGAGRQCELEESTGRAGCVCVRNCPPQVDYRRKVCSNHNESWASDCSLYQMRCFCDTGRDECTDPKYKHAHVDYFGECRELEPCTPEEMEDFPRRMREWLFNVMKDLADRHELDAEYMDMEQEAENDLSHRWANAVIWKFCDLDSHPTDRSVSRHELFPIRAPLVTLEHCIAPFLNSCDADDDHQITLAEWGVCLGLEEGEIQNKCPNRKVA